MQIVFTVCIKTKQDLNKQDLNKLFFAIIMVIVCPINRCTMERNVTLTCSATSMKADSTNI